MEFLQQFPTLSDTPLNSLSDLSDGVALFEALAEVSLDHFDPFSIARGIGENWALKLTNLRKLMIHLEMYYSEELAKSFNFESIDIAGIARSADDSEAQIATLFGLVAVAAVRSEDRCVFEQRIMCMSAESQAEMNDMVAETMIKVRDLEGDPSASSRAGQAQSGSGDLEQELFEARAEIVRLKLELMNIRQPILHTEEADAAKTANLKLVAQCMYWVLWENVVKPFFFRDGE